MHKKIDNIFENIIIFKVQVNSNFMVHRINDLKHLIFIHSSDTVQGKKDVQVTHVLHIPDLHSIPLI